jgi:hypothetical protein
MQQELSRTHLVSMLSQLQQQLASLLALRTVRLHGEGDEFGSLSPALLIVLVVLLTLGRRGHDQRLGVDIGSPAQLRLTRRPTDGDVDDESLVVSYEQQIASLAVLFDTCDSFTCHRVRCSDEAGREVRLDLDNEAD